MANTNGKFEPIGLATKEKKTPLISANPRFHINFPLNELSLRKEAICKLLAIGLK
jgi:hypothetical protein